jgi:cell division septation protein DedD
MLLGGRVKEVEALAAQLEELDPGSLALLEIRRALHDHQDVETTRLPTTLPPAGAASDESPNLRSADAANAPAGRYTLQLGAFGDRGRALEFQQRHADGVPGLTIEEGADARGQSLYRLRAGAWSSPDEAETAASELSDRLRLDVIVVDREATARPDR